MTADKWWATGVRIKHSMKAYNQKDLKGANKVGLILAKIKEEISPAHQQKPGNSAEGASTDNHGDN